ncbi:CstA-like transporter-associated (seleno)protein [Wenjunlia vitaminophila]|nr:CstA-like transporter-associated (seleno)protein [Wenjunlia vitaminophila]
MSGTAAYERFCRSHEERHPGTPAPSRRRTSGSGTRHREENPQSRCC